MEERIEILQNLDSLATENIIGFLVGLLHMVIDA